MAKNFFDSRRKAAEEEVVCDPKIAEANFKRWFPDLSSSVIAGLTSYYGELVRFNKAINLVSVSTLKNADSIHIADCILACKMVVPSLVERHPVFDIGSGNGFPGLILAYLFPSLSVVLVDKDSRKLEFCKHVVAELGVKNVDVSHGQVEYLADASIKNAIARGFAPLHRSLLGCRRQIASGGRFFHMKGDGWANEVAQIPSQLFSFWSPSLLGEYSIPDSSMNMAIVLTEKTAD